MIEAREDLRLEHSYLDEDVTFLLKPIVIKMTEVSEKERLIQSGAAHYSEMISEERRPDARYMEIYAQAMNRHEGRIASDIMIIALRIKGKIELGELTSSVTLCSLVRAGVPYGILLRRALRLLDVDVVHFGISIIRDRGLDAVAMMHVQSQRPGSDILFVDGWTGKGAISNELSKSWKDISGMDARLVVLADPSGHAWLSGSHEDWLIPSGILGANVSGLISRSILNEDVVRHGDFHASMHVSHLSDIDCSRDFVDRVSRLFDVDNPLSSLPLDSSGSRERRAHSAACVERLCRLYDVANVNRVKPGIAEATRAVLRRKPRKVFLRSIDDPDLSALIHLCENDGIDMEVDAELTGPYRAITLIEKVS